MDVYLKAYLANVRKFFPSDPLAVGFGISTGEHVNFLKGNADIAVVGSALLNAFEEYGLEGARTKVKELVYAAKS